MNETHNTPLEFAVVLGRVPRLSVREIEATIVRSGRQLHNLTVTSGVALVKVSPDLDDAWFLSLGGALKYGQVVERIARDDSALPELLIRHVGNAHTIGLSALGADIQLAKLGSQVKKEVPTLRRFIIPQEATLLSAASAKGIGDDGSEWLILASDKEYALVRIKLSQQIDDLTNRDRNLPAADARRGMLPTKLARMMVNIALGTMADEQPLLLDPFCGTGRALIEAMLVGSHVLGSDSDPLAIEASRANLAWAAQTYQLPNYDPDQLILAEIAKIGRLLSPGTIDAIATEPFLGPPLTRKPTAVERDQLFIQLLPLYEDLLRAGQLLLKPSGRLVAVFPIIDSQSLFTRIVDSLPRFGYHLLDSIVVARSDQWIARDIVLLRKQ